MIGFMKRVTVFLLLLCVACVETRTAPHKELAGVSLAFDHFGGSVDPLEQRMAETGVLTASEKPGHDYWLRLTNHSSELISFRSYSTYVAKPIEWYDLPDGKRVLALKEGMQIALPYGVESRTGSEVDFGPGIDMFWMAFLPPGRSVLFNVPSSALKRQRKVYVSYDTVARGGDDYRVYYQPPAPGR